LIGVKPKRTILCIHDDKAIMSGVIKLPVDPVYRMIHDVRNHMQVVITATEQGYIETALEACLSAKEKLQMIRETLLTPGPGIADPRHDYDS
jgi:hypothetical protein